MGLRQALLLACAAGRAASPHGGYPHRPVGAAWRGDPDRVGAAASVGAHGRDAPPRAQPLGSVGSWGGLNAKDFGAVGDGVTDDAAALQAAINASLKQQMQLLVPAGIYVVKSQLNVSHSSCVNANLGCEFLVLRGESQHTTEIRAGAKMHAVLNFPCLSGTAGPAVPIPTEGAHVADIAIYGQSLADYSIFAPGILYSRFERVYAATSLKAGMSFGYVRERW